MIRGSTWVALDCAVMHGYAWLAASMQQFFRDARAIKKQNRFFGAVLVLVGAGLLLVRRTAA
jgi:homoserine/homoserine lactone efflux protein